MDYFLRKHYTANVYVQLYVLKFGDWSVCHCDLVFWMHFFNCYVYFSQCYGNFGFLFASQCYLVCV